MASWLPASINFSQLRFAMLQMGHATAEAVVRAGLQLVPFSFTGSSEAVAVGNVGVEGIPVELVAPEERQEAMQQVKEKYKDLVIIDFTLPQAVNGRPHSRCAVHIHTRYGVHYSLQQTMRMDALSFSQLIFSCR